MTLGNTQWVFHRYQRTVLATNQTLIILLGFDLAPQKVSCYAQSHYHVSQTATSAEYYQCYVKMHI